jgi:hypothetical protein
MHLRFAVVVSALVGLAFGQTRLPAPTGPYPVGRQMLFWSDPARLEDLGSSAGKPREIAAYAFYPGQSKGSRVEYYPGLAGLENAAETRILRQQFGGAWNAVSAGSIQANAYSEPPLPPGSTKFPVVIFSPGGQAPVLAYQILLEELASHGYVVFGLEHGTDSALIIRPDRSMITYVNRRPADPLPTVAYLEAVRDEAARRSTDIAFSLDRIAQLAKQPGSTFRNRMDLSHIGVFGHSAGGQAAVRACQMDRRLRACLNLDGEMFGVPLGSTEPVPTVLPGTPVLAPVAVVYVAEPAPSDAQLAALSGTRAQYDGWRAAKGKALRAFLLQQSSNETYLITISLPGYVHASFMDMRLFGADPEAVLNHKIAADITRAFFNAQLRRVDRKSGSPFKIAPRDGITVERLGMQR